MIDNIVPLNNITKSEICNPWSLLMKQWHTLCILKHSYDEKCTTFNSTLPQAFNSTKLVHFIKCICVLFSRQSNSLRQFCHTREPYRYQPKAVGIDQNPVQLCHIFRKLRNTDHSLMQWCVQWHYNSEFDPQYKFQYVHMIHACANNTWFIHGQFFVQGL